MMQLAVGTTILIVVGVTAAVRCVGHRSGIHPGVVAPLAVIGVLLALVPIGLCGPDPVAELARWMWLFGAVFAVPAAQMMHAAVGGIQRRAEAGPRSRPVSVAAINELDRIEASLDSELDALVAHSPKLADSPILTGRR